MAGGRRPPAWLFGIAAMPYGAFNGVVAVALPYLLRRHGLAVSRIAAISALVQAPAIWYVFWSPVVDIKFRRRTWVLLLAVTSAVCCAVALAGVSGTVGTLTALLVVASVLNQPVSSALGGLVATVMPDSQRGRASGWTQGGILGGAVIAGGVSVWLAARAHVAATAVVIGLLIALPALAVLAVDEPVPAREDRLEHVKHMWRDVVQMLKRREVWLGFLFFLSPVGAGALMNLFSAVAIDFHASAALVIWVVAIGGVMTTTGAIAGGMFLDRFDRWYSYPIAGLLAAAATGAMLLAPLAPATYLVGAAAYALATGFGYAAFMALALELVGSDSVASGTRFTLCMAAVNVPVVYMLRLDGLGSAHFGVRGMLATDALANAAAGVVLLAIARPLRAAAKRGGVPDRREVERAGGRRAEDPPPA